MKQAPYRKPTNIRGCITKLAAGICVPLQRAIRFRGSVVSKVTLLRNVRFVARIPTGSGDFSLVQNLQTGHGAHPASYSFGTGVLYYVSNCWRQNNILYEVCRCVYRLASNSTRLTPLKLKVNVKQSPNRPGVAQRVPGGLGSQIFMTFGT